MKFLFTKRYWSHVVSTPFIWVVLLPVVALHIFIELYHQVCFRLYKIELVSPKDYFVFDRRKLSYLTSLDKLNCGYCSYVNGAFAYFSEIGHRTEYYWCGIKHANQPNNPIFEYQEKFAPYGDKEAYERIKATRCKE